MLMLGPLGFALPWLLTALAALPVLWWLLRAVPPALREVVFPGTTLLAGLADPAPVARRTPWWLMALRMAALAAAILAMAGPVWRPGAQPVGTGPILVVVDSGWAAAPGWSEAQARALAAFEDAQATGRPAALLIADGQPENVVFGTAADASGRLRATSPKGWATGLPPDPSRALAEAPAQFETLWLTDGLDHPERADWLAALTARGRVTVVPPRRAVRSLTLEAGDTPTLILRQTGPGPLPQVEAIGPDPQGTLRRLAALPATAPQKGADGVQTARIPIDLPPELRNRVTRFAVEAEPSAGAVVLADDRVRRRKVGLAGDVRATEATALLSPLHYLRRALAPSTDLIEGTIPELIEAAPDVIVMADGQPGAAADSLLAWVEGGGLLIRFAGPALSASSDLESDTLLPVRLRAGGRDAGGALAWGAARGLAPFPEDGPFAGLTAPSEVTVRAQLLPEPDPALSDRTLARLSDGTPLVTRATLGEGQLVLFHTTANAEWSNLALSGLSVQMLSRLVQSARAQAATPSVDGASFWQAETVLDGQGRDAAPGDLAPVPRARLAGPPGPDAPAGIYRAGERRAALNAGGPLVPATWPGAVVEVARETPGRQLRGWLLLIAGLMLAADAVGSAWLVGISRPRRGMAA